MLAQSISRVATPNRYVFSHRKDQIACRDVDRDALASKTRFSEKSRCRHGCQGKTVAAFKCQAISSVRAWRWISSKTIRRNRGTVPKNYQEDKTLFTFYPLSKKNQIKIEKL